MSPPNPPKPPGANPEINHPPSAPTSPSCFAKATTAACLLSSPLAPETAYKQCYGRGPQLGVSAPAARLVLLRDLLAGDRVLTSTPQGALAVTRVVTVQHKAIDTTAALLTVRTTEGTALSLTPDHAVFVDGVLAAASHAKLGALLTDAEGEQVEISSVAQSEGAVINAVTIAGTLLVSDEGAPVLAAANPFWIARLTLASPMARAVVNGALYVGGDVDSLGAGVVVLGKVALYTLGTIAVLAALAREGRKAASA